MIALEIHITGLVQGVGFRPFIYRIAKREGISGTVENRNDGVFIKASATDDSINRFVAAIIDEAPPVSRIDNLDRRIIEDVKYKDFTIIHSENVSDAITGVSPDIATCTECLSDMKFQPHRIDYPFINCTNCGPRFTIIRQLPYDRDKTTMDQFEMCDRCRGEYTNIAERRFHAQPVACSYCGPHYYILHNGNGKADTEQILDLIVSATESGKIIALKGLGGYHLICDAENQPAVETLRERKGRDGKPFAVMCSDIQSAKEIAEIDITEENLLKSWQRPVVLLRSKGGLAPAVSNSLNSVGIVLPYMPIHTLLFERIPGKTVLFTSANISEEPVIVDDNEALEKLSGIADVIIGYNRMIHNRADDSVAKVIAGSPVIIRRSRGYAPSSIITSIKTEGIFAAGAELVNCFAIGKGNEVVLSQHIGDLKNEPTLGFYKETYRLFCDLFRFKPVVIARDLHPDYLSSRFADSLEEESEAPVISVQHHHAHVASCMAENNLDEQVIGLSLDGVGLGTDGNIWGGEILIADYNDFERVYHFDYVPIVGSDRVAEEPWRSGLAYLLKYYPDRSVVDEIASRMNIDKRGTDLFCRGIEKGINSHYYSSAGRLFDAVASITGVNCISTFHSEAPMRLESVADNNEEGFYDYEIEKGYISFGPAIEQIVNDVLDSIKVPSISARFHNSVANALIEVVCEISRSSGIRSVVLSGGTFQNSLLTGILYRALHKYNYKVYLHSTVPQNDGGIALGQLAIAAYKTVHR